MTINVSTRILWHLASQLNQKQISNNIYKYLFQGKKLNLPDIILFCLIKIISVVLQRKKQSHFTKIRQFLKNILIFQFFALWDKNRLGTNLNLSDIMLFFLHNDNYYKFLLKTIKFTQIKIFQIEIYQYFTFLPFGTKICLVTTGNQLESNLHTIDYLCAKFHSILQNRFIFNNLKQIIQKISIFYFFALWDKNMLGN